MTPALRALRDQPQLATLLQRVLERIHDDLPGVLGVAIAVHDSTTDAGAPVVLCQLGAEGELVAVQTGGLGGPVADSLTHQLPIVSLQLWADDRWPELTLAAMTERLPDHARTWEQVGGAAAVPGVWGDGAVVLSCTLDGPATAGTVATLISYEHLVSAALVTVAADSGTNMADVLAVLQSRSAIEQAKGAVMGRLGCDADGAWVMLRDASQRANVKLRALAVALVEHIGGGAAEQQISAAPIEVNDRARYAAKELWEGLAVGER
ncbi:ANTAR domain-containing protein [Mycobacterium sp. CPCC 205372]|uniref:ANTAR domain-containing protein n=1 Tax=Mycobacterium hippophais TaxID=3016340 RepID=A0ABT4Q188_9MYCO|nr:ANTAR domain-containing protein [Mycobacterium hippophais]MCZ8382612.1 ANTAR domain-containing protein [Mycobacterium hippophais]